MRTIMKNGYVVDPQNRIQKKMDIALEDGKVVETGENLGSGEIVDVSGNWVFPGVIDSHLHLYKQGAGCTYRKVVETGVTTAIDFAGPVKNIVEGINELGYGLNVGCVEAISRYDSSTFDYDISAADVRRYIDRILREGALGPKLLCGHYPITPQAIERVIAEGNRRKMIVAYHAGSTVCGSDLNGMKEAVRLCGENAMILAHINAYLRGRVADVQDEIKEAFSLLKKHANVVSDCHLAVMNGCFGKCIDDIPEDNIVKNCLESSGLEVSKNGILEGIRDRKIKVIYYDDNDLGLLEGEDAFRYYTERNTEAQLSFAVNIPQVAAACFTERVTPGGDFLIPLTGTDGGYIPRNNIINRVLHYYALGYITLPEAVCKMSVNAAKIFGLKSKGHLGVGADADISIVDPQTLNAVMSYIGGKLAMKDGLAVKRAGVILTTEYGEKYLKEKGIRYDVIIPEEGRLYRKNL